MAYAISRLQVALFLASIDKSSRMKIAALAAQNIPSLSDVDPVLLPLPDVPVPEFPEVQIQNEKTGWAFQFAPARCDFVFTPPDRQDASEISTLVEVIGKPIKTLWTEFQDVLAARGHRLGFIANLSRTLENAPTALQNMLFKPEFTVESKEVQAHFLRSHSRAGLDLNHWTRVVALQGTVTMIVDVNTVTEKPVEEIDDKVLDSFLRTAVEMVDESRSFYSKDTE